MNQNSVLELHLPSNINALEDSLVEIESFLMKYALHQDFIDNLIIAVSELISNAMEHGNRFNPNLFVNINIEVVSRAVVVRVRDYGRGFDADHLANPLEKKNLFKTEGRGIFITRHLIDHLEFIHHIDGTEAIITKHFNS